MLSLYFQVLGPKWLGIPKGWPEFLGATCNYKLHSALQTCFILLCWPKFCRNAIIISHFLLRHVFLMTLLIMAYNFTKCSFFYFSKRDLFHQKPSTNEIDQSAFGLDSFFDWIIIGIWVWNIYKKLYDSTALVWQPVGDRKNRSIKRQFLDIVRCPVKLRTARFFPGCDTITVVKLVLVLVTVVRTVGHWSIMKCRVLYWKTMNNY